jgi:hypothetical protein
MRENAGKIINALNCGENYKCVKFREKLLGGFIK